MHLFTIEQGTEGWLIRQQHPASTNKEAWIVRRDLVFSEMIVDPLIYHNRRGNLDLPAFITNLARRGYAVFGGQSGGEVDADYLLAVPYEKVSVA